MEGFQRAADACRANVFEDDQSTDKSARDGHGQQYGLQSGAGCHPVDGRQKQSECHDPAPHHVDGIDPIREGERRRGQHRGEHDQPRARQRGLERRTLPPPDEAASPRRERQQQHDLDVADGLTGQPQERLEGLEGRHQSQ